MSAIEKLAVDTIRTLSMDAVQKANSGHPGTPMALAPIAYVLYTRVMKHAPSAPEWPDRDRFVLSAGHASMLLYSMLYLTGYGMTLDDLREFRQVGSRTPGHPEFEAHVSGIETTTGPLGQGISTSVGIALSERMLNARFGDIVDHFTYVIASDGDMQEGVQAEAASLAGHLGLGRLIVIYDDNHISIEGDTALAFSEDVGKRYEAYGWHVQNLGEDIELDSIERALETAKGVTDQPSLIITRTHIAPGAPNKQDTAEAHGSPLGAEEVELTKQAYGWPSREPFFVPDGVLAHYEQAVQPGEQARRDWLERFDAYREKEPERAAEFERMMRRDLPEGWDADLPRKGSDAGEIATRKASEAVIQWAAAAVPELVGGSADLAPSTNTLIKDSGSVEPGDFGGRNLHFGIREHAMGAVVNGLTLNGFRGYGATFLVFSDYMKASVRLAAVMGMNSIFVYTHDSIGLGEDGPTHQPIEQLAQLRATPRVCAVRPADFNETALGWRFALAHTGGPVAFALSRQNLPTLDGVPADAIERGAYVLRDCEGEPDLILMGTGSEVHLCLEVADALAGVDVRVVSMPCLDTFEEQEPEYRDSVLPPAVRARVAIEAAAPLGWHRWVGEDGDIVCMAGFGASGPYKKVYEHFGFTVEAITPRCRAVLERVGARR